MIILTTALVSSTDMLKNYKMCREKAESLGKVFVLKSNQPDAVLFSISGYEKISPFVEYLESLDEQSSLKVMESLFKDGSKTSTVFEHLSDALANLEAL